MSEMESKWATGHIHCNDQFNQTRSPEPRNKMILIKNFQCKLHSRAKVNFGYRIGSADTGGGTNQKLTENQIR